MILKWIMEDFPAKGNRKPSTVMPVLARWALFPAVIPIVSMLFVLVYLPVGSAVYYSAKLLLTLAPNRVTASIWRYCFFVRTAIDYAIIGSSTWERFIIVETEMLASFIEKHPKVLDSVLTVSSRDSRVFLSVVKSCVQSPDKHFLYRDEDDTPDEEVAKLGFYIPVIYKHKTTLAKMIMNVSMPEKEDYGSQYWICDRIYNRFVKGWSTSKPAVKHYGEELKGIYNAMFRPVFHMKIQHEGLNHILMPNYYPHLDTSEGLLYEAQINKFSRKAMNALTGKHLKASITESNLDYSSLPVEWQEKLSAAMAAEIAEKYYSAALWKDDPHAKTVLPYWALGEVKLAGLL